nr:hypothetical protein [Ardenticatenia bacterium]
DGGRGPVREPASAPVAGRVVGWQGLPKQGLDNAGNARAVGGSGLYVGGYFTQGGDASPVINLGYIARYDTTANTWHALPRQGLDSGVYALAVVGSDLYVGGASCKPATRR